LNWNVPQRVALRAVDNQTFNVDRTVSITATVAGGTAKAFDALIRDDDRPAPLDADLNGDRVVDGSDFLAWQRGLGAAGSNLKSQGDVDNDGVVGAHDLLGWKLSFANAASGDFNRDGSVSNLDLGVWSSAFGVTAASSGDADADGDADGNDFLAWQRGLTAGGVAFASFAEAASVSGHGSLPAVEVDLSSWFYSPAIDERLDAPVDERAQIDETATRAASDRYFSRLGGSLLVYADSALMGEGEAAEGPRRQGVVGWDANLETLYQ
jgi:hypothetical protein